jgi:multicomponent Na+:H+ antiporter subunit F
MFIAAGVAILVAIFLFLLRALLGPTTYDRILALNAIGTKTVILVSLMGFIGGRPDFLDIALLYALMNFIATIAILKFVEYKRLG